MGQKRKIKPASIAMWVAGIAVGTVLGRVLFFADTTDEGAPFVGIIHTYEEDCVMVADVLEDGRAYQAGMQAGDRIVSVNGIQVSSPEELRETYDEERMGRELVFGVLRGNEGLEIPVDLTRSVLSCSVL